MRAELLFSLCLWATLSACGTRQGPPIPGEQASGTGGRVTNTGGAASFGGNAGASGEGPLGGQGGQLPLACPTFLDGKLRLRPLGTLAEASGLAVSRVDDTRLYSHNDSGDIARVYVLDENGNAQGNYKLNVPQPVDWEDMAAYSDESGVAMLIFADIGDNSASRENVAVVRTAEPTEIVSGATVEATVTLLSYPDGAHNAESLFVDERDQRAYVLTKEVPSRLYSFSLAEDTPSLVYEGLMMAWPAGFLPTGADMRADLGILVVRSLTTALIFPIFKEESVKDALMHGDCSVQLLSDAQAGEAIALDSSGNFFTITEHTDPLAYYERVP